MSSFESEMEIIYEQQDIKGIFYKSVFFIVGCSADYCAVILQLTYKFILKCYGVYTDQMAKWDRASGSCSVDSGFDSESS